MIEQRSPEWFAARVGRVTGSRMSALFAKGRGNAESSERKNYRAALACERLTGKPASDDYQNFAMRVGTEREPDAIALYQAVTGDLVESVGFIEIPGLLAGASPDGLIGDDGVIEVKCPNRTTHIDYMRLQPGAVPSEYFYQVHTEIWATDRQWCDFVSYNPDFPAPANLIIRRIVRDDSVIEQMRAAIDVFSREVDEEATMIRDYMTKAAA